MGRQRRRHLPRQHSPSPSWQQLSGVITSTNKGSTTLRNGPDVSANANFTFYTCADQTTCLANEYGGTSFAAPMWAGYIALVNQQLATNGDPTHRLHQPHHLRAERHLQLRHRLPRHHQRHVRQLLGRVTGYDLVTGWGSPNGAGLITALLRQARLPPSPSPPRPHPSPSCRATAAVPPSQPRSPADSIPRSP